MRKYDVSLQRPEITIWDAHGGELPETRVDPVDRFAARHDGLNGPGAYLHCRNRSGIERHGGARENRAPVAQRHLSWPEDHSRGHAPPQTRAGSGLKAIRYTSSAGRSI